VADSFDRSGSLSAHANVTNPVQPKRILLVAANAAVSPVTQWPVGFWWAELTHPCWEFTEAGYTVEIRSPDGGALQADGYSDPEDVSGYSAHDILSLGFKKSPMITFRGHAGMQALVARFHEAGKVVALVCHATCLLLETRLSGGELLVHGKTWTGFADSEEAYADAFVGMRIQPFWIETEARQIAGTNFVVDQRFRPFAVRDGRLITGQQQFSGAAAARLVIETLGR
jgi:putative intracellular protease/amidase